MNCAASESQTPAARQTMKAVQVHSFGGLDAMIYEDVPLPIPGPGQVLVRVAAAGVGPWDAWIREGKSVLAQPLPLVLGADLSGIVAAAGAEVTSFNAGDDLFGVTNARFTGAYAEYALAEATMIRRKSPRLSHVEAASMPVVASTAWQMLFNHAQIGAGTQVLVLGGNGNVGGFAVQLAHNVGASVVATAPTDQRDDVRSLGADEIVDVNAGHGSGSAARSMSSSIRSAAKQPHGPSMCFGPAVSLYPQWRSLTGNWPRTMVYVRNSCLSP
jgi:NADPH:quinone reductase-like Zn-dependent oxidoreductase